MALTAGELSDYINAGNTAKFRAMSEATAQSVARFSGIAEQAAKARGIAEAASAAADRAEQLGKMADQAERISETVQQARQFHEVAVRVSRKPATLEIVGGDTLRAALDNIAKSFAPLSAQLAAAKFAMPAVAGLQKQIAEAAGFAAFGKSLAEAAGINKTIAALGASAAQSVFPKLNVNFVPPISSKLAEAVGAKNALLANSIAQALPRDFFKAQVNPILTGWEKSGLFRAFESWKPILARYERGRRILSRRGAAAAHLLAQLPRDATIGDTADALAVLLFGDLRALRRLRDRAREHPAVARLLDWIALGRRVLADLASAAYRFVVLVVHDLRNQWRACVRLAAGLLHTRSPGTHARRPKRHARALARLGRAGTISNANRAASVVEAVAA